MSVQSFLRRSVPEEPHLWFAIILAGVFFVREALEAVGLIGPSGASSKLPISILMVGLLMLVAERLRHADRDRDRDERIERIAMSSGDKKAALRRRPSSAEEYAYLWGGYTGRYYVFNPSYSVDMLTGESEVVSIFVHRYRNPQFEQARYVFLTKDQDGQNDLEIFCTLMQKALTVDPSIEQKIQIKEVANWNASDALEIYFGIRDGQPTAVMELKDPTLRGKHGKPDYYILIHDRQMIENQLQKAFNDAWEDPVAKRVNIKERAQQSKRVGSQVLV